MNEKPVFWTVLGKVSIVVIFGILFAAGGTDGMGGLWVRRYLGAAVLAGGVFWYSRDWRSLLIAPLSALTMSLGYGSDILIVKVLRRALWGCLNGVSSSLSDLFNKRFLLAGLHIFILMVACIILGAWNGLPNAVIEQFAIGCIMAFLPVMSARRKNA